MPETICYEIRIILSPQKGLSWVGKTKPVQSSKPISDLDNVQSSLGQVESTTEVGQEQAESPPVLGLALAAAEELGIEPKQKEVFINFMAACLSSETDEFYIKEWASRFLKGFEKLHCDRRNLVKLTEIRETLAGKRKLFPQRS